MRRPIISVWKGLAVGLAAFAAMGLLSIRSEQHDNCEAKGGEYVRTTWWFTCVGEEKK